jgi:parallel beta-helix repeat protein
VLQVPGAPTAAGPGSPTSDYSYVTASVLDTTVSGDVYGLFLANATGASIHNVTVTGSRMDGIVLHRFVSDATIVDSTVSGSALSGFQLSRAARSVRLDNNRSSQNGLDGIYVDGRPLATGPTATGTSLTSYGTNVVLVNNTLTANKHYGIELRGGRTTTVNSNTIVGSISGIVVADSASAVTVTGNRLSQQATQAIALRDGVSAATVDGNTVNGGTTAVYLRNAAATVEGNTLSGVSDHGVSVLGASPVQIKGNTISGTGPSAVDLKRATKATSQENVTVGWTLTKSLWAQLASVFQPLTLMWTALALILLFTAMAGHRHRGLIRHPYARQAPMSSFTDLAPIMVQPDAMQHIEPVKPTSGTGRRAHRTAPAGEMPEAREPVEAGMA